MGKQDFTKVHFKRRLTLLLDELKEGTAVRSVDETVVEYAIELVAPQPDELVRVAEVGRGNTLDPVDGLGQVAQREHVMALGRGGQELLEDIFVQIEGCFGQRSRELGDGMVVVPLEVPIDLGAENPPKCILGELVGGNNIEMAEETRRDFVSSAAWRTGKKSYALTCQLA